MSFTFERSPENPLILGPMAGCTDRAFRMMCKREGAGLVCMEMVSANAIKYGNKKTVELLSIDPDEHPVSLQLFGPDPETMAYAASFVSDYPYDVLDINFGCPMPKIVNNGEGSALMRDPALCGRIVEACVKAQDRPVTVKMRSGYSADTINAPEVARICEAAGASAIAVHGRTREMYYTGQADWQVIRDVTEAVHVPVIGNGDVLCAEDAVRMRKETGCSYVMIARAARGNPWIFSDTGHFLETGEHLPTPSKADVADTILAQAKIALSEKGEYISMHEMRKHVAWYVNGFPKASHLRRAANTLETYAQLEEMLNAWKEEV